MPLRFKVLSIAFALLVIFGTVIVISTIQQRKLAGEIDALVQYNMPVRTSLSNFDVLSDEYELIVLRLARRPDAPAADIESESARARQDAGKLREEVRLMESLLDQGIDDYRMPEPVRLTYSELKSAIPFIARQLDTFIEIGERVLGAIGQGRFDQARTLSLEFRNTEQAFGPDVAAMRHQLAEATETDFRAEVSKMKTIERLNYVLFGLAVCLGIGIGGLVSENIVRALRRLVQFSKAVQAGERSVAISVGSHDELGQLAAAFNSMVGEIRAKERIQNAFGMFVDPRIVADIVKDKGDFEHADRQVITVFFSDIAGFTTIGEELTAMATVNLLNHYFTAVTESIRANKGILDKFIGDAVMAFWCAPFSPGDTHAAAACLSAMAQQVAIMHLNQNLPNILGLRRNPPTISVRMGIATGEAVVGTIGSMVSKSFTAIGDTVNLASRLESVNKVFGTRIIVSESTQRLAKSEMEFRELDLITVAGKTEPIRIYELFCAAGQLKPDEAKLLSAFDKALAAYRQREWDTAEQHFRSCVEINRKDGPSTHYLERIATLRQKPPAADWDCVWRFTHK
jgi:adenylate cyclase